MATAIGETLRVARRQRGVSLGDAAAETRVRERYLAALEHEEFAVLGGDVYVKGFLRSYARYLGLDPEPLVEEYRRVYQAGDGTMIASTPVAAPVSREARPPGLVVAGAAGVLVIVVLAAIGLTRPDVAVQEQEALAPAPVAPTTEPAPATDPAQPTAPVEPAPQDGGGEDGEPAEGVEVVLEVRGGESWMRVLVDGANVLEGIRGDGFAQTFAGEDEVSLRLGNPSVVSATVNGEEQGPLGPPGQPVDVTFTAEA